MNALCKTPKSETAVEISWVTFHTFPGDDEFYQCDLDAITEPNRAVAERAAERYCDNWYDEGVKHYVRAITIKTRTVYYAVRPKQYRKTES